MPKTRKAGLYICEQYLKQMSRIWEAHYQVPVHMNFQIEMYKPDPQLVQTGTWPTKVNEFFMVSFKSMGRAGEKMDFSVAGNFEI